MGRATTAAAAALALGLALRNRKHILHHLKRLLGVAPPPLDAALLSSIETCIFDCEGVVYRNKTAIEGVPEALAALRRAGKRLIFVTNAASQSRTSLAKKLGKLGIDDGVQPEDCVTSASAAAAYLARHHPQVKSAYVVGSDGLLDELRLVGIEPVGEKDTGGLEALLASGGLNDSVDAVVVGMCVEGLCYARMAKAAAYVREDPTRPFVGTNPDCSWPGGVRTLIPAGGCNVHYVAYASERAPEAIVGKPSRDLAMLVAKLYSLTPETTLMVGDRCNTDVAFGRSVGWHTLLVLSGCHTAEDARAAPACERPDYMTASVADLAGLLAK